MAEWQKSELKDFEELKALSEAGTNAIELVNSGLAVVQTAGEAAKLFLLGTVNPALLALIVAADAMIDTLQNFKESGLFIVQVNPFEQPYGLKNGVSLGLKMERDAQNNVLFNPSVVKNINSSFYGRVFTPNDEYRKSLNLKDLDVGYRDVNGHTKNTYDLDNNLLFTPPFPRLSKDLKIVEGGYDPATWTGTAPTIPQTLDGIPLPEFPAPECIELLAAAFEDEGDVSRFKINLSSTDLTQPAYTFSGEEVTFTDSNSATYFDPTQLIGQELYKSKNDGDPTTAREPITTLVSSGKPNYQGNTELTGISVSALAMVVASQNPIEWVKQVSKVLNLFGPGFEEFKKGLKQYGDQLAETSRSRDTIRVRVDSKFGGGNFVVGDFIIGKQSQYIGKIIEIQEGTTSVIKTTEYSTNALQGNPYQDPQPATAVVKTVKDLNEDGRFTDMKIIVRDYNGKSIIRNFEVGEAIIEAEPYTYINSEGNEERNFRERYEEEKFSALFGGREVPDNRKPKQGFILNQFPTIPDSVTPDFYSYKLNDLIPGYGAFFDDMINIAKTIKAFAEGVLEAIQIIIDAIDDIVEYFEEVAANIIALIKLLTDGLPNAGVWFMGMTSQNGSQAFADALRSAGNAPDNTYKISAGFCFVGAPQFDPDPVKKFFSALGVEYQSVG